MFNFKKVFNPKLVIKEAEMKPKKRKFYAVATFKNEDGIKNVILGNAGDSRLEARNEAESWARVNGYDNVEVHAYK